MRRAIGKAGVVIALVVVIGPAAGVGSASIRAQDPSSVSDIARMLGGTGKAVVLPNKSKARVKQQIDEKSPAFPLPFGPSPAVLVQLPEYKAPYQLVIVSDMKGKFGRLHVIVPTATFLDADFQPRREMSEKEFVYAKPSWSYGARLEAVTSMGEANRSERYLLLFTDPRPNGQGLGTAMNTGVGAGVVVTMPLSFSRALDGELIVEVRPKENDKK